MWEIIKDRLLWSLIILLISSWVSYLISRHMLKKNLKSNLYIDELKDLRNLLKEVFEDIGKKEPILMTFTQIGYRERINFQSFIGSLSLDDFELNALLGKCLEFVEAYNKYYFEYNRSHEERIDEEERNKLLDRYIKSLNYLYKKINRRIEIIIT